MSVPQRHTLATSAAAVATALTLGIAITPTAGAGSVDLPETSSAGSGSSAGSAPGSTTGSGALDDLLDRMRMRTQIHTVTDSEFVRGPLAHAILDLNPDTPVVVLGAQINEDCSRPEVLQDRLDAATRLLASHPRNPVIVTGGRSDRCPSITEAEAMTQGLRDRGVRNRIVLENNAWNTLQNVEYTAPVIRKLGGTAVVVTSDPHYLRALANYRDAGIRAFGWVGGTG